MSAVSQAAPRSVVADDALRFEHLVQINDARDMRVDAMSREQLWRGLMLRAQAPKLFIPWLDEADIRYNDDGSLQRTLRFGDFEVHDRVTFEHEAHVHYEVEDHRANTRFRLTMRIEEPAPAALFVRFTYEAQSTDHHAQSPLSAFVRGAYRQADEDTVFRIRQFAASGALEEQ